jgi:uncharacterized protein (DUF4415 family)
MIGMEDVRVFKNGELFKAFDVEYIKRAHMLAKLIQADGDLVRVEWDSPDGLMYMVRKNRWIAAYAELPVRVKRALGRPKSDNPKQRVTGRPNGRPKLPGKAIRIRLPDDVLDCLKMEGNGDVAAGIIALSYRVSIHSH